MTANFRANYPIQPYPPPPLQDFLPDGMPGYQLQQQQLMIQPSVPVISTLSPVMQHPRPGHVYPGREYLGPQQRGNLEMPLPPYPLPTDFCQPAFFPPYCPMTEYPEQHSIPPFVKSNGKVCVNCQSKIASKSSKKGAARDPDLCKQCKKQSGALQNRVLHPQPARPPRELPIHPTLHSAITFDFGGVQQRDIVKDVFFSPALETTFNFEIREPGRMSPSPSETESDLTAPTTPSPGLSPSLSPTNFLYNEDEDQQLFGFELDESLASLSDETSVGLGIGSMALSDSHYKRGSSSEPVDDTSPKSSRKFSLRLSILEKRKAGLYGADLPTPPEYDQTFFEPSKRRRLSPTIPLLPSPSRDKHGNRINRSLPEARRLNTPPASPAPDSVKGELYSLADLWSVADSDERDASDELSDLISITNDFVETEAEDDNEDDDLLLDRSGFVNPLSPQPSIAKRTESSASSDDSEDSGDGYDDEDFTTMSETFSRNTTPISEFDDSSSDDECRSDEEVSACGEKAELAPPRSTCVPTIYQTLTKANIDWCRYCGTTEGVNWRPGPWGKRTLCNRHGCDYKGYGFACKLPRLDLTGFTHETIDDRDRPVLQLFCRSCHKQESYVGNVMTRCEGCWKAYHQRCYLSSKGGIPDDVVESDQQWFCDASCRDNLRTKQIVVELPRRRLPLMSNPKMISVPLRYRPSRENMSARLALR